MGKQGANSDHNVYTTLNIQVLPNASVNCVGELLDDGTVKIRLAAPPVDGKANKALIRFLAKTLGVSRDCVEILRGWKSRRKIVRIKGMDSRSILEIFQKSIKTRKQ